MSVSGVWALVIIDDVGWSEALDPSSVYFQKHYGLQTALLETRVARKRGTRALTATCSYCETVPDDRRDIPPLRLL